MKEERKQNNSAEIIYLGELHDRDYDGEGIYGLIFNDDIIGTHFCSNRDFANHDLTIWQLDNINEMKINRVYSNNILVWEKDNEQVNNRTNECFIIANKKYEGKNCNTSWVM